jgi:hypothetical protein
MAVEKADRGSEAIAAPLCCVANRLAGAPESRGSPGAIRESSTGRTRSRSSLRVLAIYRLNQVADCLCDLIAHPDRADPADVAIVTGAVGAGIHTMGHDEFHPVAAAIQRIGERCLRGGGLMAPEPVCCVVTHPWMLGLSEFYLGKSRAQVGHDPHMADDGQGEMVWG